jgi:hypothetical protein
LRQLLVGLTIAAALATTPIVAPLSRDRCCRNKPGRGDGGSIRRPARYLSLWLLNAKAPSTGHTCCTFALVEIRLNENAEPRVRLP